MYTQIIKIICLINWTVLFSYESHHLQVPHNTLCNYMHIQEYSTLGLHVALLLLIVVQTSKEYGAQKRVQLLLSITKEKQTYIIIQYLLYTRPYIHIDKLLNSY